MAGRSSFIAFSVAAHVALALGLGKLRVSESHAATAIEIASLPKAKKEPSKALVEPEPPKRERRAPTHHAAPPPPSPVNTPPPPPSPVRPALSEAVPDFGLSLAGAVGGDGIALPPAGAAAPAVAAHASPVRRAFTASVAPTSAASACDEPVVKPHPVSVPQPAYNASARAAGIEGKVRVRLTVDETGHVVDVSIIAGLGYGLDEAALAAAREATFEPATQCGKSVRATFTISMRFTAG